MILLEDLGISFGPNTLFSGLSVTIGARDRFGLVGPNGAGKSSLLRIINAEAQPDAGRCIRSRGTTTGYLPQDGFPLGDRTLVEEVESAAESILSLRRRIAEAEARLHDLSSEDPEYSGLLESIGLWEHRLELLDASRLRARSGQLLAGLGFTDADHERPVPEFSGGWRIRIGLARLLLASPDILLLDEPTNHLDLPSQRWLESFLQSYDGALVLVSHDRAFLDALTRRTLALDPSGPCVYTGNYSRYEIESAHRLEVLQQAKKNQDRRLDRTRRFIDRFRYKASKARQVQSRIKALARESLIELPEDSDAIDFTFPEPAPTGQVVLELRDLHKRYGDNVIFDGLDFKLERGERIAVVGPNGAGKSTLVRILAGVEPFDSGERVTGLRVRTAYFAQHQTQELNPDHTLMESLQSAGTGVSEGLARNVLGAFLFSGDDVFKQVRVLSGGEKSRLALARILLLSANCLIFDEPTNHLDMASKAVLGRALEEFPGAVVLVSHDRDFLNPIVNQVVEITPGRLRRLPGTVAEYLKLLEEEERRGPAPAPDQRERSATASPDASTSPRERRRRKAAALARLAPLRKQAAELEDRIAVLEKKRDAMEERLADPATFRPGEDPAGLIRDYETTKTALDTALAEWTKVSSELETLDAEAARG
ncbi:MAG: ABC transporter ATP-binding protein [Puniceicoccaceae bacterium]|nr:MAG: ABC transporter ATP-binding protein [Puniceicoccaceae bacterium]